MKGASGQTAAGAGPRRVLLLGATGRLGRMLAVRAPGIALTAPGRADWAYDPARPDDPALAALMAGCDSVINFAGITPTAGRGWSEAAFETANVGLAAHVLEQAAAAGVRRVLLASSASVYGAAGADGQPLREDTGLPPPVTPYAGSKRRMEALAATRAGTGPEIACLRIATVAGADQLVQNAMRARDGGAALELHVFPGGRGAERSYIGPEDLADACFALARHPGPLPPVLNLAAPQPVFMDALLDALGSELGWRFAVRRRPAPAGAIARVVLDTARLEALVPLPRHEDPERALAAQLGRHLDRLAATAAPAGEGG